jgi:hypothetical protein
VQRQISIAHHPLGDHPDVSTSDLSHGHRSRSGDKRQRHGTNTGSAPRDASRAGGVLPRYVKAFDGGPGREMDHETVGSGEEDVGQGQEEMVRLPNAGQREQAERPQELVVSLQMYDELKRLLAFVMPSRRPGYRMLNRNVLYLVISVLAVAAVVFGYQLYQERQKTTGIEINVGKGGISIEKK